MRLTDKRVKCVLLWINVFFVEKNSCGILNCCIFADNEAVVDYSDDNSLFKSVSAGQDGAGIVLRRQLLYGGFKSFATV